MVHHVSRVQDHQANYITWHAHKGFELLFLSEGALVIELSDHQTVELHGGHFLVVPPGQIHRGFHDVRSPATLCGMTVSTSPRSAWAKTTFTEAEVRRLECALMAGSLTIHALSSDLQWLIRLLAIELGNYALSRDIDLVQPAIRCLVCGVLVETVRRIMTPPNQPGEFVTAAMAYLRNHHQETVRISDVARHVGFGRARLFDLFKAETGFTPNDYLQRIRVAKGQELLIATNASVTAIAMETGFSSSQYFSTVFRRYSGFSPAEYRAMNRSVGIPVKAQMFRGKTPAALQGGAESTGFRPR